MNNYQANLKLDDSWQIETQNCTDELGATIIEISASHIIDEEQHEDCHVEINVGPLPEEITAEDEAFANYVDLVGFTDDEQENPIRKEKFNNKPSFVFDAEQEDGSQMRVICCEIRKECLIIITLYAINIELLDRAQSSIEHGLRIHLA